MRPVAVDGGPVRLKGQLPHDSYLSVDLADCANGLLRVLSTNSSGDDPNSEVATWFWLISWLLLCIIGISIARKGVGRRLRFIETIKHRRWVRAQLFCASTEVYERSAATTTSTICIECFGLRADFV